MDTFVTTFEDACAKLGKSTQLPDASSFPDYLQKHVIAAYKLSVILEVNNGEWKPDITNTKQWKYYPWFEITPDTNQPSGFGLSFSVCVCADSGTDVGVRLACKSEELAEFMGNTFTDLYKDLLS